MAEVVGYSVGPSYLPARPNGGGGRMQTAQRDAFDPARVRGRGAAWVVPAKLAVRGSAAAPLPEALDTDERQTEKCLRRSKPRKAHCQTGLESYFISSL